MKYFLKTGLFGNDVTLNICSNMRKVQWALGFGVSLDMCLHSAFWLAFLGCFQTTRLIISPAHIIRNPWDTDYQIKRLLPWTLGLWLSGAGVYSAFWGTCIVRNLGDHHVSEHQR